MPGNDLSKEGKAGVALVSIGKVRDGSVATGERRQYINKDFFFCSEEL